MLAWWHENTFVITEPYLLFDVVFAVRLDGLLHKGLNCQYLRRHDVYVMPLEWATSQLPDEISSDHSGISLGPDDVIYCHTLAQPVHTRPLVEWTVRCHKGYNYNWAVFQNYIRLRLVDFQKWAKSGYLLHGDSDDMVIHVGLWYDFGYLK